jgi:hypothetical protein
MKHRTPKALDDELSHVQKVKRLSHARMAVAVSFCSETSCEIAANGVRILRNFGMKFAPDGGILGASFSGEMDLFARYLSHSQFRA